jgi:pimeloyl-ACP methyl ester carboxylesterase
MTRRRAILLGLLAAALGVAVFGHPWRWTQAALLMADIAAAGRDTPWQWITRQPERRPISWTRDGIDRAGDLYLPAAISGAMVLSPGAAPGGRGDPRLVAFATSLARAGFAVLVPDIADLRNLRPSANDVASIVDAAAELGERVPTHKPGVMAVSYALGPTLIAAARSDHCAGMGFIVGIGGFHDLREVVRFFTTGHYQLPGESQWREAQPNEFGKWLFVFANAYRLDNEADRELLLRIAQARMADRDADIGDWFGRLGPDGRRIFDLIANTDPRHVDRLITNLPPPLLTELERLNPARQDLRRLDCRVILLHGRDDRIIPYSQSIALKEAIGGSIVELHLPDAIGHVEFTALQAANIVPLWRAIDSLLALRD